MSPRLVTDLLAAAVAAPSLHNSPLYTQPWRFRVRRYSHLIELRADPARAVPYGDPSARAIHIACGAALVNLRLAAAVAGIEPVVKLLPDPAEPVLLATVRLAGPYRVLPDERELYAAIFGRAASRPLLRGSPVPTPVLAELADAARVEGAILHLLGPDDTIRVRDLARGTAQAPSAGPGHRGEQLAMLSAHFGDRANWLRAGQALQRVRLTAIARGIAMSPLDPQLPAPLEAAEAWLATGPHAGHEQPQMVLAIGPGLPVPPVPRRPVERVLN